MRSNVSSLIAAAALGLAAIGAPLAAQTPTTSTAPLLTLDAAIAEARAHSRMVKVAALDVLKADDDLAALRTRRRPVFDIQSLSGTLVAPLDLTFKQGVFGIFPQIGPVPGVDTQIRTDPAFVSAISAQVAQPLTQLRKVSLGEKALSVGRQIAQERVRREEQTAAYNTKRLYYGIVQAQSGIRANGEALRLYRELDRLMGEYLTRQVVLEGESLQVKAALARQEHMDLVLHNTVATLKEQLNTLLGRDITSDFSVNEVADAVDLDVTLASAQTRAAEQRPEVREARLKVQQAEYDLRLKQEDRIPAISVAFNYLGFYNFEVLPQHVAMVGIQGSWEPWDWGRKRAEANAKARTVEQARLGVSESQALVDVDVRMQWRKLQEARALLKVADLERRTSAEKLRVALQRFKAEAALQREVLEAQAKDAEAGQQYQQALAAYWTARADFEKALGEQ